MRPLWRRTLVVLAALLLLLGGLTLWVMRGFDGAQVQRAASDWMRQHHQRELAFDGPVTLQLWPQPAVSLQRVRLSERGRAQLAFAGIEHAALSLRLRPLLFERAIEVRGMPSG